MPDLSASQRNFVRRMTEGEEFERHGVDLLVKQQRFEFFDAIAHAGLFDPARNPRPVPADKDGYFRVPYWHVLDYLKAAAKHAGDVNDSALAEKVIGVVRTVSRTPVADGKLADNYNTTRVFVEILGLVPTRAVSLDDIELIHLWIGGRFDRGMVGHPLAATLDRFVGSEDAADWAKACRILYHATAIQWSDEKVLGKGRQKPESVVDDYWLKDIIGKHIAKFGHVAGEVAATILLKRTREVYSQELDREASWLFRPAIEKHEQNHSWDGITNVVVEGLRDVLLSWMDTDEAAAKVFVCRLLKDDAQIIRRVAIHVVDEKFLTFRDAIPDLFTHVFSDFGQLHEVYRLLQSHFHEFTPAEQRTTLEAIRAIVVRGKDPITELRSIQRVWLSAIQGKGSNEADAWFAELQADPSLKGMLPHPDFHSYHESHSGFGNSPYTVPQLQAFADGGVLIDTLNAFEPPSNSWDGPTTRALTDLLAEAVAESADRFLAILPEFERAKRPYQYAVISGFKRLWDAEDRRKSLDWNVAWPTLLDFFSALITPDTFWTEEAIEDEDISANRDWIPPLISEVLRGGTRDDTTAFDPGLLPQAWGLVQILLRKSQPQMKADAKEAMNRAINSSKGKAVEAMIDCALRRCRVRHKETNAHDDEWGAMQPSFDAEIAQCRNANFEFSTLAGAHLGQLRYLSPEWTSQNFHAIFPLDFPANCLCALGGLAFSQPSGIVYEDLTRHGVIAWALRQDMPGSHTRKSILQRIALAYLWGKEPLDGAHLGALFDVAHEADLGEIASYFWSVSNQKLEADQVEKILAFWDHSVKWATTLETPPASLMSALSALSCYLPTIDERGHALLAAVAPFVAVNHNADRFLDALEELAPDYPDAICDVFGRMLSTYKPNYDFQGRIKSILTALSQHGPTRARALGFANQLSDYMPKMLQLYRELADTPPL
ncbi:MAG: hypothetical protein ACK52I_04275 [Pseudomonadota bacterium]|jgi:hypothetical protein